jgi:hypothetical protein
MGVFEIMLETDYDLIRQDLKHHNITAKREEQARKEVELVNTERRDCATYYY